MEVIVTNIRDLCLERLKIHRTGQFDNRTVHLMNEESDLYRTTFDDII